MHSFFLFFSAMLCSTLDFSFLTRDRTGAPCSGSVETSPLRCPGSPSVYLLTVLEASYMVQRNTAN